MSYILDALRRAESERERDRSGTPGLNSQLKFAPDQGGDGLDDESPGQRAPWPWSKLLLGLVVGLGLGLTAWWWLGRGPAEPTHQASAPVVPASPTPAVVAQASPVEAPAAPASAPALAPMPTILPEPQVKPPKAKAERTEKPAAPKPVIEPRLPGSAEAVTPPPRKPPAERVQARSLQELPEGLRRELPPLSVSGSMYSPEPASRMLVLDGQVVREGDQLRPGLVLETIGVKAATLNFRGERFQLSY